MNVDTLGNAAEAPKHLFFTSLIAGGMAGTSVDIALFPIDTIKTRLQSKNGFFQSGGFRGLYKGITPVILGSAPTAALFFVTYESTKNLIAPRILETYHPVLHMAAASMSEMVACLIRVPVEVVKQRKQALLTDTKRLGIRLLYRGFFSTVLRDMPFSLVQFPLWEYFKKVWGRFKERDCIPFEGALCGAVAGAVAAATTTPLDVVKTRIMLANRSSGAAELKILYILDIVYRENGFRGLFSGIGPRVTWITLGGFIFFGVYEEARTQVTLLREKGFKGEPNR